MAVLADVSMNNKLFSSAYDCASYVKTKIQQWMIVVYHHKNKNTAVNDCCLTPHAVFTLTHLPEAQDK